MREEAIDRVLEQNLAYADREGLDPTKLRELIRLPGGDYILSAADIRASLIRLIGRGRVEEATQNGLKRCVLSTQATSEVDQAYSQAQKLSDAVVMDIFAGAKGPLGQYADGFLEFLCNVFSRMSSGYIAIMAGNESHNDDTRHLFHDAMVAVLKSRPDVDKQAFEYGVTRFFKESTPQFDAIKWNMAQNFYVALALGIDPKARVLSSDLLAGAVVFLDTNVLIAGLTPENRQHGGFQEVIKMCKNLGVIIKVAQITVDELRRVVAAHTAVLRQVWDRIPIATRPKVHCFLLESYLESSRLDPNLTLESFLMRFQAPIDTLREAFGLETEDDPWFDSERSSKATTQLAQHLSAKFKAMRFRPKTEEAARHDALLLRWVDERRCGIDANCRIATLDLTLVAAERDPLRVQPRAITLEALLQWASPHCSDDITVGQVAAIYSTALRYQLLPTEQFLDARDFRVFAEMEIETAQLPSDDVEACVREIRKVGPNLDPGKAEDREKLSRTIQRFFADPGTKFKKVLADLETKNRELTQTLSDEIESRRKSEANVRTLKGETSRLSEKNQQLDEKIANEQSVRSAAEQRIHSLETNIQSLNNQLRKSQLVRSIIGRCILITIPLLLGWYVTGLIAIKYGDGATSFQKLTNAWPWFGLFPAIAALLFPYVIGRERMRYLKRWRGEDK